MVKCRWVKRWYCYLVILSRPTIVGFAPGGGGGGEGVVTEEAAEAVAMLLVLLMLLAVDLDEVWLLGGGGKSC